MWTQLLPAAAVGYLAGSLPSADLTARASGRPDVDLRSQGTSNPGATNAGQLLGRRWGTAVLVLDVGKASLACLAGRSLAGDRGAHVAGVAAVIGHCYPWHHGGRGGKGLACCAGQQLVTFPAASGINMTVGALAVARRSPVPRPAALLLAGAFWVGTATLWWWRRWPDAWAGAPTRDLPLAAAASTSVVLSRYLP